MAKFYVQSGMASVVISSDNAENAAVYLIKRTIDSYFPIDDIEMRLLNQVSMEFVIRGLDDLEPVILVSQVGLGRSDAGLFDKARLFASWGSQVDSIDFLFERFAETQGD